LNTTIIGGADGPTSIFISSPVNWLLLAGVVVVACGIALFFILRGRRK